MAAPLNHAEIEELLGAYALDAVDDDERALIAEYLARTPDARHDVVDDINPRVVGDSDALAEDAEIVVNLVICDTAVGILRAALPVGVYPDGHLADVLDDVVLYDCVGVRRLRAVDAELCVNVLAVVDDAGGERGVVAVNGEAFEGDAVGVEGDDDRPGEAGVDGVA